MSTDSNRVGIIKRKLVRRKAWHHNYLDEIVDSTLRILGNELSNKGPRAQVNFLLEHGWSVKEIVKAGRKVRNMIFKHMQTSLVKPKKKRRHQK